MLRSTPAGVGVGAGAGGGGGGGEGGGGAGVGGTGAGGGAEPPPPPQACSNDKPKRANRVYATRARSRQVVIGKCRKVTSNVGQYP
ncbi:hypothetical protein EOD73_00920 [Inhella crocodyli]|uniref:Uncharacterized protein n=1 Tax=Inhella crocodyli TaxID=2499851 RepID=A0A3S2XYD2_9BURK|nr:hypothetical protein EOD73_00920 [Inhella crocodyli]